MASEPNTIQMNQKLSSACMADGDQVLSIPRGGPIYLPNFVSPLTNVPRFETAVLQELQNLQAELDIALNQLDDADNLCMDDLKVCTDEELAEMAIKEVLKDLEHVEVTSRKLEVRSNLIVYNRKKRKKWLSRESTGGGNSASSVDSMDSSSETIPVVTKMDRRNMQSKRIASNFPRDNGYMEKIKKFLDIKEQQNHDREEAANKLHSLRQHKNKHCVPQIKDIERIKSLRAVDSAEKVKASDILEHIPVSFPEEVLCIEVYQSGQKWVKIQEFLVLGRQTFAELKDKIKCLADQTMQNAGLHNSSGYFLIEDVFLNDLRYRSCIDYSEPIIDWLRNSKEEALKKWERIINGPMQKQQSLFGSSSTTSTTELPRFRAVTMHETRFCDLNFHLGAEYLYCHQGNCQHTIIIRDMRMIHQEDVQNRAAYPIVIFQLKQKLDKCDVCKIYRASVMMGDNVMAGVNPCYVCDHCLPFFPSQDKLDLLINSASVTYDYPRD